MSATSKFSGPQLFGPSGGPASGGAPKQVVILAHGLGANGDDLIGLAPYYAQVLPDALFISPNAPFACDMGGSGYQWFSYQDRAPDAVLTGVRAAAPILDAFIDRVLAETGLPDDKLALVGFSQGTMMSLFVSLRRAKPIAGVVGYSGRLIAPETLAGEIKSRPPVVLVHGDRDDVVPISVLPEAVTTLKATGVPVDSHIRPGLPHSIDAEGIEIGCEFLARVLGVSATA
jgi:phospholipase/carboxylesterase